MGAKHWPQFLAENLLLFFLFYELELIPLWLLISIWGGSERAYAATKFLIFTAVSGMLILGAFLGLALFTGTVDFSLTPITSERLAMGSQIVLLSALLVGFALTGLNVVLGRSLVGMGLRFQAYGVVGGVLVLTLWIWLVGLILYYGQCLGVVLLPRPMGGRSTLHTPL